MEFEFSYDGAVNPIKLVSFSCTVRCSVTKRAERYLELKIDQWVLAAELVKVLQPVEIAITLITCVTWVIRQFEGVF